LDNLGICYERGTGVAADADAALAWFERAAAAGRAKAQASADHLRAAAVGRAAPAWYERCGCGRPRCAGPG